MKTLLAKVIAVCACGMMGTAGAATTYFASDFNAFADNVTTVNGGSNSLTAYGNPVNFGIVRSSGTSGKALTIYGGDPFNGAASGAFGGLADRISSGEGLLRMTGEYRTTNAFNGDPWNQTAQIQFQNTASFSTYTSTTVSSATPNWTPFTLDLNIAGLNPAELGQVQANFFLPGTNPGDFQVDNLTIQTVPEPTVSALLAGGAAAIGIRLVRLRSARSTNRGQS